MYKTASRNQANKQRRRIIAKNADATRSIYDKPFFALPSYMNEDYQKIKEPMSPNQFLERCFTPLREKIPKDLITEGSEKYNLFENFPFGKLKGSTSKSFSKRLSHEDENYMNWLLYALSKEPNKSTKLVRSLYYHISYVREYLDDYKND